MIWGSYEYILLLDGRNSEALFLLEDVKMYYFVFKVSLKVFFMSNKRIQLLP